MKKVVSFITSVLVAGLISAATTADAQVRSGEWDNMEVGLGSDKSPGELENWLNTDCRPDNIRDISGLLIQHNEPHSHYTIQVFCKRGAGRLKQIKVEPVAYNSDGKQFASIYFADRENVLAFGYYSPSMKDGVFLIVGQKLE
jgi:hypothetical protein